MDPNILSHSIHHTILQHATDHFFKNFFSGLRKSVFTGTIVILGSIQWFSNLNKAFHQKLTIDSESAQKTESNEGS